MKNRDIVKAALEPKDKEQFDKIVEELGMKQQEAFGRLVRWFSKQHRLSQILVMGLVPEGDSAAFRDLVRRTDRAVGTEEAVQMTADQAMLLGKMVKLLELQRAQQRGLAKRQRRLPASA